MRRGGVDGVDDDDGGDGCRVRHRDDTRSAGDPLERKTSQRGALGAKGREASNGVRATRTSKRREEAGRPELMLLTDVTPFPPSLPFSSRSPHRPSLNPHPSFFYAFHSLCALSTLFGRLPDGRRLFRAARIRHRSSLTNHRASIVISAPLWRRPTSPKRRFGTHNSVWIKIKLQAQFRAVFIPTSHFSSPTIISLSPCLSPLRPLPVLRAPPLLPLRPFLIPGSRVSTDQVCTLHPALPHPPHFATTRRLPPTPFARCSLLSRASPRAEMRTVLPPSLPALSTLFLPSSSPSGRRHRHPHLHLHSPFTLKLDCSAHAHARVHR